MVTAAGTGSAGAIQAAHSQTPADPTPFAPLSTTVTAVTSGQGLDAARIPPVEALTPLSGLEFGNGLNLGPILLLIDLIGIGTARLPGSHPLARPRGLTDRHGPGALADPDEPVLDGGRGDIGRVASSVGEWHAQRELRGERRRMRAPGTVGCRPFHPGDRDLQVFGAVEEQVRSFALTTGDQHRAGTSGDDALCKRSPVAVAAGEDTSLGEVGCHHRRERAAAT